MTEDSRLIFEARQWLDQLDQDLQESGLYEKSGEDFAQRIEWQIRRYEGAHLAAIKAALKYWLTGTDEGKFNLALDLIWRLHATEHIGEVEKIRDDIRSSRSPWSSLYLSVADNLLKELNKPDRQSGLSNRALQ